MSPVIVPVDDIPYPFIPRLEALMAPPLILPTDKEVPLISPLLFISHVPTFKLPALAFDIVAELITVVLLKVFTPDHPLFDVKIDCIAAAFDKSTFPNNCSISNPFAKITFPTLNIVWPSKSR